MDELKKYLQQNRSSLDVDRPGNDLWSGIQPTPNKRAKSFQLFYRVAIAACIIPAIFLMTKWVLTDNHNADVLKATADKVNFRRIASGTHPEQLAEMPKETAATSPRTIKWNAVSKKRSTNDLLDDFQ